MLVRVYEPAKNKTLLYHKYIGFVRTKPHSGPSVLLAGVIRWRKQEIINNFEE
jgi:hypothetical protein